MGRCFVRCDALFFCVRYDGKSSDFVGCEKMRASLLAVFLTLFIPLIVLGQSTAYITGTVTDADGAPLAGINIYLERTTLGAA